MTSVTNADLHRDFGHLEGSQEAMKQRMDKLERTVEDGFADMNGKVAEVRADVRLLAVEIKAGETRRDEMMGHLTSIAASVKNMETRETERRGAWRVVVLVAGAVSAIVAGAWKFFLTTIH